MTGAESERDDRRLVRACAWARLGLAHALLLLVPALPAELAPGATLRFSVIAPNADRPDTVEVRVVGEETVSVPAGAFPAFKLEIRQSQGSGTLWVRKDKPHWLLKQEAQQGPQTVRVELRQGRASGS